MPSLKPTQTEHVEPLEAVRFQFHHFPELDGFRGLAILLVITGHVLDRGFRIVTDLGELGVLLFFILSGFLITGLLDREVLQTGQVSLSAFYTRRVLRIFPASFFYIAVLCLLMATRLVTDTPWYAVAACMLFVRNIWGRGAATGHIWSLSLEEQFYAMWPWIFKRLGRLSAMRVAALAAVGISAFRMLCIHQQWFAHGFARTYYYRPWFRFDAILVGCALVLWLGSSSSRYSWRKYFGSPAVAALSWPALFFWTLRGQALSAVWHLTIQTALASIVFMNVVLARRSVVDFIFRRQWLRWFGRISYSWYLWQQLFTQYSDSRWGKLIDFPFNIVASLTMAVLSYSLIERPFLRLKERFR